MKKRLFDNDSNDMTSMVDVTFLLLIFFVVTASFATSSVIRNEPSDQASTKPQEEETPPPLVRVLVDEHDQFFVGDEGVEEAVDTPRELRDALRTMMTERNAESVLIEAHESSRHGAVVQVCDASRAVGLGQIKVNPYK